MWIGRVLVLPTTSTYGHIPHSSTSSPVSLTVLTEMTGLVDIVIVVITKLGVHAIAPGTWKYFVWLLQGLVLWDTCLTLFSILWGFYWWSFYVNWGSFRVLASAWWCRIFWIFWDLMRGTIFRFICDEFSSQRFLTFQIEIPIRTNSRLYDSKQSLSTRKLKYKAIKCIKNTMIRTTRKLKLQLQAYFSSCNSELLDVEFKQKEFYRYVLSIYLFN